MTVPNLYDQKSHLKSIFLVSTENEFLLFLNSALLFESNLILPQHSSIYLSNSGLCVMIYYIEIPEIFGFEDKYTACSVMCLHFFNMQILPHIM